MSLMVRIVMKALVDCTGAIHFRHPLEMGGAYFCWNTLLCLISCFAAAGIYANYYTGEPKLDSNLMFVVISTVTAAWLLAFSALLLSINRDYLRTFLSRESGCQYAIRSFSQAPDDEHRIQVFRWNENLWSPVRRDVKKWTKEKFSVWRAENPAWLTDEVIARIPDEFMPAAALAVLNASGRRSIRKKSILERALPLAAPAGIPQLFIGPLRSSVCEIHIGALSAPSALPSAPSGSGPSGSASIDAVEPFALPVPLGPELAATEGVGTAPELNGVQLYECDYRCGFTGSFQLVAQHEVTCAKRTDTVFSFSEADPLISAPREPPALAS
jgi:hypothetical protein